MTIAEASVSRASYINVFIDLFEDAGMPFERWMSAVHLPESVREMPDAMVPNTQSISLIELAEARCDMSDLAFRAARNVGLHTVSSTVRNCILSAPTLFAALMALSRSISVEDNNLRYRIAQTDQGDIRVHSAPASGAEEPYSNWCENHFIISVVRAFVDHTWTPETMAFMGNFPPGELVQSEFPNTRFLVAQPTAYVTVPAKVLPHHLRCCQSDGFAWQTGTHDATARPLPFSSYLRAVLKPHILNETAQIDLISELMGLSERTLQRRLEHDNVSFRQLVNETRMEQARELLADRTIQVLEVASCLGYKNANHFSRAFRNLNGLSPAQFRSVIFSDTG